MDYLQKSNAFFDEQTKKGFLNRTVMLQEVKIVETKNLTPNSSNLNRSGSADQTFTAKDLETAFSLSQYLQGRVVGVTIRNGMAYSNRANGGAMNIVLDGMNMGEDFQLDDIVVQDIESVEVLRTIGNTAIYGSNGTNGVLVITTKRGGNTSSDYNRYTPGIVTYSPKGYQISREFYSPKYNVNPEKNRDLRTTVYWNPHLNTDKNGNVIVNYFNTDMSGNYRIVVEGIDYFGNIGRKVYNYEVK
jgi:TonB-dependent SusC/RagA subfamily outer membrane receptor